MVACQSIRCLTKSIFFSYGAYDFVVYPRNASSGTVIETLQAFTKAGIPYTNLVISGAGPPVDHLAAKDLPMPLRMCSGNNMQRT